MPASPASFAEFKSIESKLARKMGVNVGESLFIALQITPIGAP